MCNYEVIDTGSVSSTVSLIDIVACKYNSPVTNDYIVTVYIPPYIFYQDFELFCESFELFIINKQTILLLRDFNLPHFTRNSVACPKVTTFSLLYNSLQLKQYNNKVNCDDRLLDLSNIDCDDFPFVPLNV